MSADFQPFVVTRAASAPVQAPPISVDGFEAGREHACFTRFRDQRQAQPERTLATLAALAAPADIALPWSNGLEQLQRLPCPIYLTSEAWDRIVWTALRLDQNCGADLHGAGWDVLQVFGANPDPSAGRRDRDGLALLLAGWAGPIKVQAVLEDCIELEVIHGGILRYRRFDKSAAVPMWLAFGMAAGP